MLLVSLLFFFTYTATAFRCPGWTSGCNSILQNFAGTFRYNPPLGPGTSGDGLTGDAYIIYAANGYRFESSFLNVDGANSQIQYSAVSRYSVNCKGYRSKALTSALTFDAPAVPISWNDNPSSTTLTPIVCNGDHLTIPHPPNIPGVWSIDVYPNTTTYVFNFGNATHPYLVPHVWTKVSDSGCSEDFDDDF